MDLQPDDQKNSDEACAHISSHKAELIQTFVLNQNPVKINLMTIFMAGSPGSGKTEFAQRYLPSLINIDGIKKLLRKEGFEINENSNLFIHIDVDKIRDFIPQYTKTDIKSGIKANSHIIQKAANKGLDILRDYCFKNDISFLHDGTFGNFKTMRDLVVKSLGTGRMVQINYLYLDPVSAWNFTQAREYVEGRNIILDKFIDQYFSSRQNVDKIKIEFGDKVKINCIFKNPHNQVEEILFNQRSIDSCLQTKYNDKTIVNYSRDDLYQLLK